MDRQHAELTTAMVNYDRGDAKRIQHFIKVHDFAAVIGTLEGLDEETQFILETAAILHDIGIRISEQKYGSSSGKYQEKEGPAEARRLMEQVGGYTEAQMERVEYLVAHHHTYQNIQGMDHQILVEADFLVNLYEEDSREQTRKSVCERIFRTQTGIRLFEDMFAV